MMADTEKTPGQIAYEQYWQTIGRCKFAPRWDYLPAHHKQTWENVAEPHTKGTKFPVCPTCGHEDLDCIPDLLLRKKDGDSWASVCPHCDERYRVTIHVSTTFDTQAIKKTKGDGDENN